MATHLDSILQDHFEFALDERFVQPFPITLDECVAHLVAVWDSKRFEVVTDLDNELAFREFVRNFKVSQTEQKELNGRRPPI